jgi:hypothetical protein
MWGRVRTVLIFLLAMSLTYVALGQEATKKHWKSYRSETHKVTFLYRADWDIDDAEANDSLVVSPGIRSWGDAPFPPSPHPWFVVLPNEDNWCRKGEIQEPVFTLDKGAWFAVACRDGKEVYLGYWDRDPDKEDKRLLLAFMLERLENIP